MCRWLSKREQVLLFLLLYLAPQHDRILRITVVLKDLTQIAFASKPQHPAFSHLISLLCVFLPIFFSTNPQATFFQCYTVGGAVVKNPPANAGYLSLIPRSGRSPGVGNGNPLQCACLENPTDRAAWWATVHGVAKSRTQLSD